jgi:uncharacterized metal-binding protein YceD (DUF177 family)
VTGATPEFSRPVPLARLRFGGFRQEIEAGPEERRLLAERFGLLALGRLTATVELRRQEDGTVLLTAAFAAAFEQSCVVTLDPVADTLCEEFSLVYGPGGEAGNEVEVALEETSFEPLDGDAIDIGEAVAQEFSLLLPQFPRLAEATVEVSATAPPREGPFDALADLIAPK